MMTPFDRVLTWTADFLAIAGCLAGAWFLYLAVSGPLLSAGDLSLMGLGCALIPVGLAVVTHNNVMRARVIRRDAE